MEPSQTEFIKLCIASKILQFGEFTLKSGRISPYFFNTGLFSQGALLSQLARQYSRLIATHIDGKFMLYGPAYKGIPLATATAMKLSEEHNLNASYAFNRKETKDHGEGGNIIGAPLCGNVVIIDDVITAGTSAQEAIETITLAGANPHSIIIALDRQEVADGESLSATLQITQEYGIPVYSIINVCDLIAYLQGTPTMATATSTLTAHHNRYGVQHIDV